MNFAKVCQQQKKQLCFSNGQHRPRRWQLEKTQSVLRLPSSCRSSASPALCRPERPFCSCCLQKNQSYRERNSSGKQDLGFGKAGGAFLTATMSRQGSNTPSPNCLISMDTHRNEETQLFPPDFPAKPLCGATSQGPSANPMKFSGFWSSRQKKKYLGTSPRVGRVVACFRHWLESCDMPQPLTLSHGNGEKGTARQNPFLNHAKDSQAVLCKNESQGSAAGTDGCKSSHLISILPPRARSRGGCDWERYLGMLRRSRCHCTPRRTSLRERKTPVRSWGASL